MTKSLTPEELTNILENTTATLAIEDLYPSRETIHITKNYLLGLLTEEEALQALRDL